MRMTIVRLTATLLFGLAQPVCAQVLGDAEVIETLMLDKGLPVNRGYDSFGDPRILSEIDGIRFSIYFYDCDAGPCDSIQFIAGFDDGKPADMAIINTWNREFRFAKAYVDEAGNALVEMDVNLGGDGIGRDNFNGVLESWRSALAEFQSTIDW